MKCPECDALVRNVIKNLFRRNLNQEIMDNIKANKPALENTEVVDLFG